MADISSGDARDFASRSSKDACASTWAGSRAARAHRFKEAADDLVLLGPPPGVRISGDRFQGVPPNLQPDLETMNFLDELGEIAAAGGDIRSRVFAWPSRLLPRHRDPEALLRRDQVVGILRILAEVDLDPLHPARELGLCRAVVVADRRCAV